MTLPHQSTKEFDHHAACYEQELNHGLSLSGESPSFFAGHRILWTARQLNRFGIEVRHVMDYGCGTGLALPFLRHLHPDIQVRGVDVSEGSLEIARKRCPEKWAVITAIQEYVPAGNVDLVYANGVYHHIPRCDRQAALDFVSRTLRPGGFLALWENNPWNPGTRLVMSRIPFDQDADPISAPACRHMLRQAKFEVLRTDFLFLFPRFLRWLRFVEPWVCRLPLGTQYLVLARKPSAE